MFCQCLQTRQNYSICITVRRQRQQAVFLQHPQYPLVQQNFSTGCTDNLTFLLINIQGESLQAIVPSGACRVTQRPEGMATHLQHYS